MAEETEQTETEETPEETPEKTDEPTEETKEEKTEEEKTEETKETEEKKPEETKAKREQLREMSPNNVVYVGKKGVMNYVMAVMTQFNQGIDTVSVKARGRSISRAVDVAEILKNKFVGEVKVQGIDIQTEELDNDDGTTSKVSAIEILLNK